MYTVTLVTLTTASLVTISNVVTSHYGNQCSHYGN